MIDRESVRTASQCRHYAMCKIDFLGTGLCPPGEERHFVSFFPQGRMDIWFALSEGIIPFTARVAEIIQSCDLCGRCDRQCWFITGLRPLTVMKAMKEYLQVYAAEHGPPAETARDAILDELAAITGGQWSSNDPADRAAYADDPSPASRFTMPAHVTLPGSADEVRDIVELCREHRLDWAVRGNGGSVMGLVMSPGVVIDLRRMRDIAFDPENWSVTVGPGVAAFELQKEARARGFRVNTAESSALLCANVMCSGIFSLFSASYGTMADNVIDAEFVGPGGAMFRLNDRDAPNLSAFVHGDVPLPGICTSLTMPLHPLLPDEEGVLVPFGRMEEGLAFARELGMRRIGTAVGVLGAEYVAAFISPTVEVYHGLTGFLDKTLGAASYVLVVGTAHDIDYIRRRSATVVDGERFASFMLGVNRLMDADLAALLEGFHGDRPLFELLFDPEMFPVVEAALDPSPESYASTVDDDMRAFFTSLYRDPRMTDLEYLSTFRILTARLGRRNHVVAFIVYAPLDSPECIMELAESFAHIAEQNGVEGAFGFVTPLDGGRRAVFEYDYFLDHRDGGQKRAMLRAMEAAAGMLMERSAGTPRITWIRHVFHQGFARKEFMLYGGRDDHGP